MRLERTIAAAKESLGEAGFKSASRKGIISHKGTMWEAGQWLTMQEAVELALKEN